MSMIVKDNTIAIAEEMVGNLNLIKNKLKEKINELNEYEIEIIALHLSKPENNNVVWNYKKLIEFHYEFSELNKESQVA